MLDDHHFVVVTPAVITMKSVFAIPTTMPTMITMHTVHAVAMLDHDGLGTRH